MFARMLMMGVNMGQLVNRFLERSLRGFGAAPRRSAATVGTARALLVAYAMAAKAKREISRLSGPRF